MTGFAIYRFPGERRCITVRGRVDVCPTVKDVAERQGFAIAPFDTERYPIVIIRPDEVMEGVPERMECHYDCYPAADCDYRTDFEHSMEQLRNGKLQKVVLARMATEPRTRSTEVEMLNKACELYPNAFITLYSTPQTGTWLIATPELLLARGEKGWHTMALAGTMTSDGDWSDKNRHEQRIVDEYIGRTLQKYSKHISQTGPKSVKAGGLIHLRTDFDFDLATTEIGPLLEALHPTPAVCGLPKEVAFDEITHHHTLDRQYYSGFCGPVGIDGATRLYVALRCMRIDSDKCTLYAGGGLLPQSEYEAEYAETDSKMETISKVLRC